MRRARKRRCLDRPGLAEGLRRDPHLTRRELKLLSSSAGKGEMRGYGCRTPLEEQAIGFGERNLDLGSVAPRADHSNPRDGCGDNVHRGTEDEGSAGD